MDKKIIAFAGTHGIGKTTLTLALASQLKSARPDLHIGVLSEVVRNCPYPVNLSTSPEAQAWIFATQMQRELEMIRDHDLVIADRSILDNIIYALNAAGFESLYEFADKFSPTAPGPWGWLFMAIAMSFIQMDNYYRKTVFLSLSDDGGHAPTDDGFRTVDQRFQLKIDKIFKNARQVMIEYQAFTTADVVVYWNTQEAQKKLPALCEEILSGM